MSERRADTFVIYLRNLPGEEIGYRTLDDGARHVLQITSDISLYIRPDADDNAAEVAASLRKLAAAAGQMAAALDPAGQPAARFAADGTTLLSALDADACPDCGHDHGSLECATCAANGAGECK